MIATNDISKIRKAWVLLREMLDVQGKNRAIFNTYAGILQEALENK